MGNVIEVIGPTEATLFHSIDAAKSTFPEGWLQEVLRRHPEVLPVEEFGPAFQPLVAIGREFPTEAGPIDNLYISHAGYLVLVETKLWRNREASREVVAQVWHYARALSRISYEKLDEQVKDYLKKYGEASSSLQEWIESRIEPLDVGFQGRVSRNIRLGRFLVLIVTDYARPSLLDMLSTNAYPSLAMDIGILELRPFRRGSDINSGVLLVPYVPGRTQIVERSVVEVTVQGISDAQVTVSQVQARDDGVQRKRVLLISENAFWELMHDEAPEAEAQAKRLIDEIRGAHDRNIETNLREKSIVIEALVSETETSIPLFFLKSNGTLVYWPETIRRRVHAAGLPQGFADDYVNGMRAVLGATPNRPEPSQKVNEVDLDAFQKLVADFMKQIEEASPTQ